MGPLPKAVFLTKGVGRHREKLSSFELSLRAANIAVYNLVRVKSIFPPNCKLISQQEGLKYLSPGQIVFAVMSDNATNEPHRLVASSVGVAIPANAATYGYLSEHHSFGETDQKAGDYAEDLAATMLATTLGISFDPETAWNEREQVFKMEKTMLKTRNVVQSAEGSTNGKWSTVVALGVFIF